MDLNPRQLFTLNEMGIPVWELRTTVNSKSEELELASDSITEQQRFLLDKLEQCQLVMITEEPVSNQQHKRLFDSLIFSLNIDSNKLLLLSKNDFKTIRQDLICKNKKPLIVFSNNQNGDFLADELTVALSAERVLLTYSLAEFLAQPELKAQAWQAMKSFKPHISKQVVTF